MDTMTNEYGGGPKGFALIKEGKEKQLKWHGHFNKYERRK